ncbi:hypothetical protein [Sporosarcina limicola]|uniref:Zinc ribbon domain-containing protein n=1 Tax=Sporosarcina limicola TaxID=34101 RepID=A0A927MMW2_9BACL|nr:hypothetical protein [Sporosarcina limicola]MBE1556042.1 hypothetical protein [Sporosarcina limicola]
MNCAQCGYVQDIGLFCGRCGTEFEKGIESTILEQGATIESVQQPISPEKMAEPNIHIEKIKAQSKMYGSYFVQQLKRPSLAFNQEKANFSNGLTSILLLAVVIALTLYSFLNSMFSGYEPGFISIFGSILIFSLVAMGISLVSLFLISRFFGPQLSFKAITSLYGGHLSPLLIGAGVSLLLLFLESFTYGNLVLWIVFTFAVFILPLYLISSLLTKKPTGIDSLYRFILYIVTFSILFYIFVSILADSRIRVYFNDLTSWF